MPKAHAIAFAVAAVLFAMARLARADVTQGANMLQFGVPAPIAAFAAFDPAHFVYVPVVGPWLDIARVGPATSALVVDGLFQDCVAFAFVATFVRTDVVRAVAWTFRPWFPQSGGGGLSLRATF